MSKGVDRISRGIIEMLDSLINAVREKNDLSEQDMVSMVEKIDELLYSIYGHIDNAPYIWKSARVFRRVSISINDIRNIVVDTSIYSRLFKYILTLNYGDKIKDVFPVKKLSLTARRGRDDSLSIEFTIPSMMHNHYEPVSRKIVDEEWSVLDVVGDRILIDGVDLPVITFKHKYHTFPYIIPSIRIDHVALNGLFIHAESYMLFQSLDINAETPVAVLNTGLFSKGSITLKIRTVEAGKVGSILQHTLIPDPDLFTRYINYFEILAHYAGISANRDNRRKEILEEFIEHLPRYGRRLGLALIETYGRTSTRTIIPKSSGLSIFWNCRRGQYIVVDDAEEECRSHVKLEERRHEKNILLVIDSIRDLFSPAKNKPVVEVIRG